jgi:hypothetical protein
MISGFFAGSGILPLYWALYAWDSPMHSSQSLNRVKVQETGNIRILTNSFADNSELGRFRPLPPLSSLQSLTLPQPLWPQRRPLRPFCPLCQVRKMTSHELCQKNLKRFQGDPKTLLMFLLSPTNNLFLRNPKTSEGNQTSCVVCSHRIFVLRWFFSL